MKKKSVPKTSEPLIASLGNHTSSTTKTDLRFPIFLAIIAFLLYANTIRHTYVLDDAGVITGNAYVQRGLQGIGKIFGSEMWHFQNVNLGYYRPLSLVTFAIENQFFPGNPHVSHFTNVFLYALTAFFLYLLLIRIFRKQHPFFSFFITILFVAHPIHTEVVANIKSRDEILSFLNLIIAAYTMLLGYRSEKTNLKWLFLSSVFFYLALLSKESAVTGILLFPLFLFFDGKLSLPQILKRTSPFLILILLFQIQKFLAIGSLFGMNGTDIVNYPYIESGSILASMFLIFAWSIKLILIPYPLCYSYAYNQIPSAEWSSFGAIAGLLIVVLIVFLIYKNLQGKSPFFLGLLLFAISLAPVMGFVFLRGGIFAERFLYAPALGFSIVIIWLLWKFAKPKLSSTETGFGSFAKTGKLGAAILFIFLIYSFRTISRNRDWRNDFSLVSHDVQVAENNCQVHLHYGMLLSKNAMDEQEAAKKQELFTEAITQLNYALQIDPHLTEAYYQIGQAYQKTALNNDSAIIYYNRSLMENSKYSLSYSGLAEVYENLGKKKFASYYFNKAVETDPYDKSAVAICDKYKQQTGLDVKQFPSENDLDNTDSVLGKKDFAYYLNEGRNFGQKGDFTNAVTYLEKAVSMNPNSEDALINLSVCYGMTKNYGKSIEVLQRALQINPNNITALTNISILYNHIGDKTKAEEFKKKIETLQGK